MYYCVLALLFRIGLKSKNHDFTGHFGGWRLPQLKNIDFKISKNDVNYLIKTAKNFNAKNI